MVPLPARASLRSAACQPSPGSAPQPLPVPDSAAGGVSVLTPTRTRTGGGAGSGGDCGSGSECGVEGASGPAGAPPHTQPCQPSASTGARAAATEAGAREGGAAAAAATAGKVDEVAAEVTSSCLAERVCAAAWRVFFCANFTLACDHRLGCQQHWQVGG